MRRPAHYGYQAIQHKISDEEVYEVHVDLEKFYDKVNRGLLVEKIRNLVDAEDKVVERLLKQFVSWKWGESCPDLYEKVCSNGDTSIPKGIPQGLVAGGFFANIYLLEFDEWLAGHIGTELSDGLRLVDYCRYVDDMRFIIVADSNSASSIQTAIESVLGTQLKELGLKLNSQKTVVEPYRTKRSGVSVKLQDIQNKLSGPLSINEVDEQLGHLEGLIGLAEGLRADSVDKDNTNPLAIIESPSNDVREDTLLRFSANKIQALLRQKRSLVAQEVDDNGKPVPGTWDFLQERIARKFIACWSRDPSLVLLLKKALEFFPDIRLLKPVVDQLLLARDRESPKQRQIAEYCLCEIFRHTATVIYNKDRWALPAHADVDTYHEWLQQCAINVIDPDFTENDYLGQQARFYLLVCNDSPLDEDTEDQNFNIIIKIIKGYRNVTAEMSASQLVTNCLLAYQLGKDKKAVLRSVSALIEKIAKIEGGKRPSKRLNARNLNDIGLKFIRESMSFFEALVLYAKGSECYWVQHLSNLIARSSTFVPPINGRLERFSAKSSELISLMGVIKRFDNPFAHENALLQLLHTILDEEPSAFSSSIDLSNFKVGCSDWGNIQRLSSDLKIVLVGSNDGLFPIPEWIEKRHKPLYRAGIFIRSCLLGSIDWSVSNCLQINEANYNGLKTSFYKRQLGMMHSPESIGGETAPMSGWLSGLLSHLLQWPGVKLHDGGYPWPKEWDLDTLKDEVAKRIDEQRGLYFAASGMPAYTERVMLDWPTDKADLKVVMVQSLLPLKKDFAEHGFLLDSPKYRARHRRHVASVAELLLHKVYSQKSIDDERYNSKPDIDLIIWPELSVNEADIDILKRLSDKTGAIIFTGLVFKELAGVEGPNNVAQWIVPKKNASGRQFLTRLQGKFNLMKDEVGKAKQWRPYQLMLELVHPVFPQEKGFVLTGSICYDATDIKLSSDLKDKSNAYIISALNMDVATFDSMVDALYYHMYQHVALVNTGEFGGSVAKAPYKERHEKLITHVHGANQVSISSFNINMFDFRTIGKSLRSGKKLKTKPAG
ncbi:RNA-directed DNA polymerase [Microbulbifer sp. EKSA008]|uniref:RNA-directed DNA polymerase n=1 Tax=Microbulbifer sp. EKSA008 TaxID=3243367 RepID=UPI00404110BD